MSLKCYFRYPDGHYCNCWAKKRSQFCGNHQAPSFATTSRDKRMHPHARLATPDDVLQLVRESLNAVRFGSMTPAQAVAINRLVESWLKLFSRSCAYNREAALRTEILPSLIDADAAAAAERANSKLASPLEPDDDPQPPELDAAGQPDPDAEPLPVQPPFSRPNTPVHPERLEETRGVHPERPAGTRASGDPFAFDPLADYGPVTPNLALRRALDAMCAPPLPTPPQSLDPHGQPGPANAQPLPSQPEVPASEQAAAPSAQSLSQPGAPVNPERPAGTPGASGATSASTSASPDESDAVFERVLDALTAPLAEGRPNGRPRDS
ncbi:MAG: hypothetical protein ACRD6I_01855 [Candidatus Acidiferrales bacterium]